VRPVASIETFDQPHRCTEVATRVARQYGFQVVNGWVIASELGGGAYWHTWNRIPGTGALADAAKTRLGTIAYLGRVLSPAETTALGQWSGLDTAPTEAVIGRLAGTGQTFGRALSGLLAGSAV
jgi:hypothetical protein